MYKNNTSSKQRQDTSAVDPQKKASWAAKVDVIRITPMDGGNVRAFASISLAGALEIHSLKVIKDGDKKPWVAMPSQQANDKWYSIVYITDPALKEAISEKVLAAWQEQTGGIVGNEEEIPF